MEGHNLKPLSEIYNRLAAKGVTKELCMNTENKMVIRREDKVYEDPKDLCIVKTYRFEGDSNPDDNSVLYVLKDKEGNFATLLDSYGADSNYSGEHFDDFVRNIPMHEDPDFNFD